MFHGHLKHKFRWDFKELRVTAIGLQDQRQHIEAAITGLPAQVDAQLAGKTGPVSLRAGASAPPGSTGHPPRGSLAEDPWVETRWVPG